MHHYCLITSHLITSAFFIFNYNYFLISVQNKFVYLYLYKAEKNESLCICPEQTSKPLHYCNVLLHTHCYTFWSGFSEN